MIAKPDTVVGANAGRSRNHNRQVVLARVRSAGQIGRAEIARQSGLSTQAVSNIIADLLSDGMILEQGRRTGVRGLPAVQFGVNPAGGFAFGVEVRPDAVFAALLDLSGETLFSERCAQGDSALEAVTATIQNLLTRAINATNTDRARVLGAGIVLPGPFGETGIKGSGSELPDWHHVDLAHWFEDALSLPVFVENDANAAAMAERVKGVALGLETYAFLYFGTGIGLGIVTQGRLMPGSFGNAGEIGHIPVPCGGKTVLLETAVSRLSVQRHLAEAGLNVTDGNDLRALYAAKDPHLMGWLDRATEPLAAAINTVENLFDPQAVILGGAMPDALLDHLIDTTILSDRSVSHRGARDVPRLLRGASGRMTATLGAASLVINRAFTPTIAVAQ
jgi:predicted NBD/HSP70 family sugar kinase